MILKAALILLITTSFGLAQKVPLAKAAEELSKQLAAGGIVTADGTTFSAAGKLIPADVPPKDLIFEIGSISKVFTGLLLTPAVIEEKVTLDTPIATILSDLTFKDPRVAQITLRQLACHTSGLPRLPANLIQGADQLDPYTHYDRALLHRALTSLELEADPPHDSSYSNLGVGLLGDLLSVLYDKSWNDLIREKITEPLKMPDTTTTLNADQKKRLAPPHFDNETVPSWNFQALAGAGALRSTAADLTTFGQALLHPEKTPLAPAIQLLIKSRSADGKHGLSLAHYSKNDEKLMGHNGGTGGYRSLLEVVPKTKTTRVILINNATLDPSLIISRSKGEKIAPPQKKKGRSLPPEKIAEYPGIYLIDSGPLKGSKFTIINKEDELWGKLSGQQFLHFHAMEKADRFFLNEVKAEFQFDREDDKISSLTLFQNGQELRSVRTDEALPKQEKEIPLSKKEAEEFLGTYQLTPKIKFTITFADETLMARLTGQQSLVITKKRKDWFEYQDLEASIEFERNKSGKIEALKLHQGGLIQRAEKQ